MSKAFQGALQSISRVLGVRGALIATLDDGLVVADTLMDGVRGNALAALASSVFQRLTSATQTQGIGEPRFVHLQASEGTLLMMSRGDEVAIVAMAEPDVNVGLVRLEMLKAVEAVG